MSDELTDAGAPKAEPPPEPEVSEDQELDIVEPGDETIPPEEVETAAEAAEAEPDEVEPVSEEEPEPVDPTLVERARAHGFSEEQIESFGPNLSQAIDAMDARINSEIADIGRRAMAGPEGAPAPVAPVPVPVPTAAQPPVAAPADAFKIELGEDYDDESPLKAVLNGLNEHYSGRVAQVEGQMKQMAGMLRDAHHSAREQEFEAMLGELGDEWAPVFGKGPRQQMDPVGEQLKNRIDLWAERDALAAGHASLGMPEVGAKALFQQALQAKFGAKQTEMARKKISAELAKNNKKITSRPTQRDTSERLTREQIAIRNAAERMAKLGMGESDELPEGFLDD